MNIHAPQSSMMELAAVKARQQAMWGSGDYSVVGTTLQIVGESLCEAIDVRSGQRVLDVAAGNGNATLAAARRFAEVTSTDYVESLLERGRDRAAAERLPVKFQMGDAENLPFGEGSFDVVLSTFGVMFAPDQAKAAKELLRVCRTGGRIGLANWTPESFIGRLFKLMGTYIPPAPGLKSPALWGSRSHLSDLFGPKAHVAALEKTFTFRYRSPGHWIDVFRSSYGPVHKAFAALPADRAEALETDLYRLLDSVNVAEDGTLVAPSEYLEVVVTKTG
jgi:ubiquinone/menaquinone biosynthesis C-methylase UbiE